MFKDLALKTRSYRRFDESRPLARQTLVELVDLARQSPSGANRQPLKYVVIADAKRNEQVFATLKWAALLKDWGGPKAGERPTGYVVFLRDDAIFKDSGVDHGISAWTMALAAAEKGVGSCMIGSIVKDALRAALAIPQGMEILLVLALGYPAEDVILEEAGERGTPYYRDEKDRHHVPKRPLREVLLDL